MLCLCLCLNFFFLNVLMGDFGDDPLELRVAVNCFSTWHGRVVGLYYVATVFVPLLSNSSLMLPWQSGHVCKCLLIVPLEVFKHHPDRYLVYLLFRYIL